MENYPDIETPGPPQRMHPLENLYPGEHENENKEKLGVALVGLGKYATGQLMPALEKTTKCYLAGLVTGSPDKAEKYSEKYKIPGKNIYNYQNFDEIANNPEIKIVYIVLPNSMHAEFSIRALKAGKHVICEKPMAVSVEECAQMIEASVEAGKRLSIGYRLHIEPHNLEAMRLGQDKVFGPVKKIEANFGFKVGEAGQWRLNKELAGGGSLMDVGIYCVQAARYVLGKEPIAIRTATIEGSQDAKFNQVEANIKWEMEFSDNVIAYCSSSYTEGVDRLHVEAENGWFELSPAFQYSGQKGKSSEGEINFPHVIQQAVQMDDFADAIISEKHTKASAKDGLQDVRILKAIYKASETGESVMISDQLSGNSEQ